MFIYACASFPNLNIGQPICELPCKETGSFIWLSMIALKPTSPYQTAVEFGWEPHWAAIHTGLGTVYWLSQIPIHMFPYYVYHPNTQTVSIMLRYSYDLFY